MIEIITNNNGRSYRVITKKGDKLLLLDLDRDEVVVATDWSDTNSSWWYAKYFTLEGLVEAFNEVNK